MTDNWANQSRIDEADLACAVERREYNLVALLKPVISLDGNQWSVLHGDNLQDGVAGFGDTVYLAVLSFNKEWHRATIRALGERS